MKKVLFILSLITITTTLNIALSKNTTKVNGKSQIEIAKPIIEIEKLNNNNNIITETTNNTDYYFKIKNYNDENEISQIQQKYKIEFSTKKPETLNKINYSVYSTNQENTSESIVNIVENETDEITIDGNIKNEDFYKLHINSVENDLDIQDEFIINLKAISAEI